MNLEKNKILPAVFVTSFLIFFPHYSVFHVHLSISTTSSTFDICFEFQHLIHFSLFLWMPLPVFFLFHMFVYMLFLSVVNWFLSSAADDWLTSFARNIMLLLLLLLGRKGPNKESRINFSVWACEHWPAID